MEKELANISPIPIPCKIYSQFLPVPRIQPLPSSQVDLYEIGRKEEYFEAIYCMPEIFRFKKANLLLIVHQLHISGKNCPYLISLAVIRRIFGFYYNFNRLYMNTFGIVCAIAKKSVKRKTDSLGSRGANRHLGLKKFGMMDLL